MHLIFLTDKLNIDGGGSNHSLDLLARSLTEHGINVELITVNVDGENVLPSSYPYTIGETELAGGSRLGALRNTRRALRRADPDLVHVFEPSLAPIAALYARTADTPVVCRLNTYTLFCTNRDVMDDHCYENCTIRQKVNHAPGDFRDNLSDLPKMVFDDLLAPRVLRHIDRFLAQSPAVREIYTSNGIPRSSISVISNFYDPEFPPAGVSPEYDIGDANSLIYVGRLYQRKGIDILLRAVSQLDEKPTLEIVGNGPQRSKLEAIVDEQDLAGPVTFHGWVEHDQLPDFYYDADIFVHPGRWPEPSGRAILEALQCGCVPLVSDIGGPPWIVNDDQLTFQPNSPTAITGKIEELRDGDIVPSKTYFRNRLSEFDPDVIVSSIIDEYNSVLDST